MAKIWFLRGVSCSGKSTWAKIIKEETNAVLLSSDDIAKTILGNNTKPNGEEVFKELRLQGVAALKAGKDIIIDATNLGKKKHIFWKDKKAQFPNTKFICISFLLNPIDLEHNIIKRKNGRWKNLSFEKIKKIINEQQHNTTYSNDGFDYVLNITYNYSKEEIINTIHTIDN